MYYYRILWIPLYLANKPLFYPCVILRITPNYYLYRQYIYIVEIFWIMWWRLPWFLEFLISLEMPHKNDLKLSAVSLAFHIIYFGYVCNASAMLTLHCDWIAMWWNEGIVAARGLILLAEEQVIIFAESCEHVPGTHLIQ